MGPILERLPADRGERVVRSWLALESAWVNQTLPKVTPPHPRSLVVEETLGSTCSRSIDAMP